MTSTRPNRDDFRFEVENLLRELIAEVSAGWLTGHFQISSAPQIESWSWRVSLTMNLVPSRASALKALKPTAEAIDLQMHGDHSSR